MKKSENAKRPEGVHPRVVKIKGGETHKKQSRVAVNVWATNIEKGTEGGLKLLNAQYGRRNSGNVSKRRVGWKSSCWRRTAFGEGKPFTAPPREKKKKENIREQSSKRRTAVALVRGEKGKGEQYDRGAGREKEGM